MPATASSHTKEPATASKRVSKAHANAELLKSKRRRHTMTQPKGYCRIWPKPPQPIIRRAM
eukprot:3669150-Amphidinium_carterae.1